MTDQPKPPEPGALQQEDNTSVSQVGQPQGNKKPVPTMVVIGILVVVIALSALVMSGGSNDKKEVDESGVTFSEEGYAVRNNASPFPAKPEDLPKPDVVISAENNSASSTGGANSSGSPDAQQRLREEEEMLLRRKHSPVVLINKVTGQQSTEAETRQSRSSDLRNMAKEKMDQLERSTQDALSQMNEGQDKNKQGFMGKIDTQEVELVQASYMANRSYKVAQGKVIPGILETAINSDLPGMLRAVVSESVYSEDGNTLLIPKGSRLVGEYRSGLQRGQTRVFVIWSRLLRPDGIDIKIDSPGTDSLGRSGLTGFVDTHFLERFGASALMSMISSYAQQETDNDNQTVALSDSFAKSAEIALENSINIPPTVLINQGERINIFVAKDLDFRAAMVFKQKMLKGY